MDGGKKCCNNTTCPKYRSRNDLRQQSPQASTTDKNSTQILFREPNFMETPSEYEVFHDCLSDHDTPTKASSTISKNKDMPRVVRSLEDAQSFREALKEVQCIAQQLLKYFDDACRHDKKNKRGMKGLPPHSRGEQTKGRRMPSSHAQLGITARMIESDMGPSHGRSGRQFGPYNIGVDPIALTVPLKIQLQYTNMSSTSHMSGMPQMTGLQPMTGMPPIPGMPPTLTSASRMCGCAMEPIRTSIISAARPLLRQLETFDTQAQLVGPDTSLVVKQETASERDQTSQRDPATSEADRKASERDRTTSEQNRPSERDQASERDLASGNAEKYSQVNPNRHNQNLEFGIFTNDAYPDNQGYPQLQRTPSQTNESYFQQLPFQQANNMSSTQRSQRYPSNYRCMVDSKAACRKPSPYSMGLAGQASDVTSRSVPCPCSQMNEQPQTTSYNTLPSTGGTACRFPVRMPYNCMPPPPFLMDSAPMQIPTTTQGRYGRTQNLMGRPRTLVSERSTPYSSQKSSSKCPCSSSANDDEFFSLSSASSEKDNDDSVFRSAEGFSSCACSLRPQGQGQPQARNMVILQLLHEVVHLINEDEKTSEKNIREGLIGGIKEKQLANDCDCGVGGSEAEEVGQYSSSIKITFTPSHKTSQPGEDETEGHQQQQMPCMPCGVFITPNMQCPACMMHAMQPQLQLLHQGGPMMNWPPVPENMNYAMEENPNLIQFEQDKETDVGESNFIETELISIKPEDLAAQLGIKSEYQEDGATNINKLETDAFAQCICKPGEHNASCPMHGNMQIQDGGKQCICRPGEHNEFCPIHGLGTDKLQNQDVDLECICQPNEPNESCPMHGGLNKPQIRVRNDIYQNGDDPNINFSENERTRTDTHDSSSELDFECEENDEECIHENARRKAERAAKRNKDGNKCDCCHCRAIREHQNKCLTIATQDQAMEGGNGYSEMKFFIDSIIMDLEAMEHARRLKQNQQSMCPPPKTYCPRQSFPVTITDVTDLGSTSLYIKWCIHDCFGIGGYEIYVDGYMTNRYFHCKHEAAVICDVDVTRTHKIVLVATPLAEDNFDELCGGGEKTDKSKSLVRKGGGKVPVSPPSAVWTPSIYLYDPANKREGPAILKCSC